MLSRAETKKKVLGGVMNETVAEVEKALELPVYEAPRLQVMSERDVLNTFQITQSMNTWWTMGTVCPCV
jgi:hypothetical protein